MALVLRSTGLGSTVDKHRKDYGVFSREWRTGRVDEANAQLRESWHAWLKWAGLSEIE